MIKFNEAKNSILKNTGRLPAEKVPLNGIILNTVLAEDVTSPDNIPNCDNSGMDGYAVKSADTKKIPASLRITGEIKAGEFFSKKIKTGETVKIMTGAPIPESADAVVMAENTAQTGKTVKILKSVKRLENIRKTGEDIKKGELVLKKGTLLNPARIGLLASIGKTNLKIVRIPKVAVITTGDEIVAASVKKLRKGEVRNSNLWTITALLKRDGMIPVQFEKVSDDSAKIESAVKKAVSTCDAVIISAGISVGRYDFVKTALRKLRVKLIFWRVAMKPGKPFAFGVVKNVPIFSLPGNPVSAVIAYEELVRPAIQKMAGKPPEALPAAEAVVLHDIYKETGKKYFLRGIYSTAGTGAGAKSVKTTGSQSSGVLTSMSKANCLIVLDEKTSFVKKGSKVTIEILNPEVHRWM